MALYVVTIAGGNAVDPWATAGGQSFSVDTRNRVCVRAVGGDMAPALFSSREAANAIGLACRWNGQTYRITAARGRDRTDGVDVDPFDTARVTSCQETYGR